MVRAEGAWGLGLRVLGCDLKVEVLGPSFLGFGV